MGHAVFVRKAVSKSHYGPVPVSVYLTRRHKWPHISIACGVASVEMNMKEAKAVMLAIARLVAKEETD